MPLLFTRSARVPREWIEEQARLTLSAGFLGATLRALRSHVNLGGQREVLLDRLPALKIPVLVVWGASDRVFPVSQARKAAAQLQEGSLELIPDCGHLPQVERPDLFVAALERFLARS